VAEWTRLRLLYAATAALLGGCHSPAPPSGLRDRSRSFSVHPVRVSAGTYHSCDIDPSGAVMCWGGLVGDALIGAGSVAPTVVPTAISSRERFVAVSAGDRHTCALTTGGEVLCWGANDIDQLGDGTLRSHLYPSPLVPGLRAQRVSAGRDVSCAVTLDGQVTCWGSCAHGVCGMHSECHGSECRVPAGRHFIPNLTSVTDVTVSDQHACALRADGTAWCWGSNDSGQRGIADARLDLRQMPWRLPFVGSIGAIVLGPRSSCVLTTNGLMHCWGAIGSSCRLPRTGAQLRLPDVVAGACLGQHHLCARSRTGDLTCWGLYDANWCPTADEAWTNPVILSSVSEFACGAEHACARRADGSLLCMGDNTGGQLGHSPMEPQPVPDQWMNPAVLPGSIPPSDGTLASLLLVNVVESADLLNVQTSEGPYSLVDRDSIRQGHIRHMELDPSRHFQLSVRRPRGDGWHSVEYMAEAGSSRTVLAWGGGARPIQLLSVANPRSPGVSSVRMFNSSSEGIALECCSARSHAPILVGASAEHWAQPVPTRRVGGDPISARLEAGGETVEIREQAATLPRCHGALRATLRVSPDEWQIIVIVGRRTGRRVLLCSVPAHGVDESCHAAQLFMDD